MADTENMPAAATNPAEVTKTESAADVKTETNDSKPEEKTTKADDGEETVAEVAAKTAAGATTSGMTATRGSLTAAGLCLDILNILRRNNREFDNLPETDDPAEIRAQV
jgi:lupus La protein